MTKGITENNDKPIGLFEKFFSEEYGVQFVNVTPKNICPMMINCGRTGWPDGETQCEGCAMEKDECQD